MSQKSLSTVAICIAVVLVIWMLHGSMCEVRFRFAGAEIAAFLQCKE
ncbi:Hok/Gef family protein [Salmonella enterica]|nr:Hok/Gef family protein [Salmonella enterica]EBT5337113.1 Hok/Gef family protein [Salmonella enterica]ECP6611832.1 Hok/Gef family protein [Salmonella enterica]EFT2513530.1 Hok/Gef family protein [Salmonella enterica]EFT2540751.1 Hok/Gef family protein [Salmonella enterica]